MVAFARALGAFFLMMAIGYLAVVLFLPAPNATLAQPDDMLTGRSAAVRLSDEAKALATHKAVDLNQ